MKREGGFSLIEVLVSIVILAIGAFAAVQIQRTSTMSNQAALNREVASALARQLLETLERVPYPDPPGGGTFANCLNDTTGAFVNPCAAVTPPNPLTPQGLNAAGGFFFRTWEVDRNTWADANDQQRVTVRVRVSWNQSGRNERVEIATVKGWLR